MVFGASFTPKTLDVGDVTQTRGESVYRYDNSASKNEVTLSEFIHQVILESMYPNNHSKFSTLQILSISILIDKHVGFKWGIFGQIFIDHVNFLPC